MDALEDPAIKYDARDDGETRALKDGSLLAARLRAGIRLLRAEGPAALARAARAALRRDREALASGYPEWVRRHATLDGPALAALRIEAERLAGAPRVSVVTPVFDPPEAFLRAAIASVEAQVYRHWELLLVDDGSRDARVRSVLDEAAGRDARIRVIRRECTGGISLATNDGIGAAVGDVIVFLDHDDVLTPDALYRVAKEFADHAEAAIVYSDEDKLDPAGEPAHPNFKPDWNPDLFLSHNILAHLCAYRAEHVRDAGGMRAGFEGAQDYDLALRIAERLQPGQVRHICRVLYHWRMIPGSTAVNASEKGYAAERARRAVSEHIARRGIQATVETVAALGAQRIRYGAGQGEGAILLAGDPRACNAAARAANAPFLVFLGEGIEADASAIDELVSHASREGVGAVGGLVRGPGGRIERAGFILGASLPHVGRRIGDPGYMMRAGLVQELCAVPIDCMCIRAELFTAVGGFDEAFARAFHDVDLCLRLRARGARTVFTPFAEFRRRGAAASGVAPNRHGFEQHADDARRLRDRWAALLDRDPSYNPNLSLEAEAFTLAWPPREP